MINPCAIGFFIIFLHSFRVFLLFKIIFCTNFMFFCWFYHFFALISWFLAGFYHFCTNFMFFLLVFIIFCTNFMFSCLFFCVKWCLCVVYAALRGGSSVDRGSRLTVVPIQQSRLYSVESLPISSATSPRCMLSLGQLRFFSLTSKIDLKIQNLDVQNEDFDQF